MRGLFPPFRFTGYYVVDGVICDGRRGEKW